MYPNQEQQGEVDPSMAPQGLSQSPMDPSQQEGEPMASPEDIQKLKDLMDAVKEKFQKFKAIKFAAENKADTFRREILGHVFSKMKMGGVNLDDRESVSAYIENLRQINPEIADQFEFFMDALLGDDDTSSSKIEDLTAPVDVQANPADTNNEINNENISQETYRPTQSSIG